MHADGAHRHPARQPGPGGGGGEGGGAEAAARSPGRRRSSTARRRASRRSRRGRSRPGDVVVIRGEGPVGGPGMREMLSITGGADRPGAGRERRPHHRRPVLRRHARPGRRPRRPGGVGRRADRAGARTATRSPSTATRRRWTLNVDGRRAGEAEGGVGEAAAAGRARRAGEVRPYGEQRVRGCNHQLSRF